MNNYQTLVEMYAIVKKIRKTKKKEIYIYIGLICLHLF